MVCKVRRVKHQDFARVEGIADKSRKQDCSGNRVTDHGSTPALNRTRLFTLERRFQPMGASKISKVLQKTLRTGEQPDCSVDYVQHTEQHVLRRVGAHERESPIRPEGLAELTS